MKKRLETTLEWTPVAVAITAALFWGLWTLLLWSRWHPHMPWRDLYVILDCNINVREVSRNIQTEVARAISEMVGMEVGQVNVHIEDIHFSAECTPEADTE